MNPKPRLLLADGFELRGRTRNNFYSSRGEKRFRSRGFFRMRYIQYTSKKKSSRDESIFPSKTVKVISCAIP